MNLPIIWKGYYSYRKGYPLLAKLKKEDFTIIIDKFDGITFSGFCIDPVTESVKENDATIQGVFENTKIYFKKKYKKFVDYDLVEINNDNYTSYGVDYEGELKKCIFSKKNSYKGKWSITSAFIDETNKKHTFISSGIWKMEIEPQK